MLAQIDDRDMRALAREQRRDRTADAAIRPRDDRDLALQPARPPIARFPIGFGFKAAFVARQGIFVHHPDRVGTVHDLSDRKSTHLNSSHYCATHMTSSAC